MIKSKRKRLVMQLDAAFSLLIRLRDKKIFKGICPFCKIRAIKCCFHFVTRAKHSLRWSERNAVGSCWGCNLLYEYDPHFAIQWYIKTYGQDAYDELIRDGHNIAKFTNHELKSKLEVIRSYLSE